jgi:CheY-like chemotaxis protein
VNLIGNAVKFTDKGQVDLTVDAKKVGHDWELHFTVRDTGIGIPSERISLLFQPFMQADATVTRRYGGTGLGLAISRKLSELLGGTIWVESEAGHGSTFHVTIRAKATDVAPDSPAVTDDFAGYRALVVDDNATNRRIVRLQTEAWRLEVRDAASPREALEMIEREPFDVVILDYQMPDMDGIDLAVAIRRVRPAVPLVLLSSSGAPSEKVSAAGITTVLQKPVRSASLHQAIAEALGHAVREDEEPPSVPAHRMRILLAEDNEVNQRVAKLILRKLGYPQVDVANNGLEAIAAIEKSMEAQVTDASLGPSGRGAFLELPTPASLGPYDVVLMDVQMPEMDGLEAARVICARWPRNERPALIAMTAHALTGDRERCLAAGMDGYLVKPIDPERLGAELQGFGQSMVELRAAAPVSSITNRGTKRARIDGAVFERLRLLALDEAELKTLVDAHIVNSRTLVDDMKKAHASGDVPTLSRAAHSLKGTAGTFGVSRLAAIAARLEKTPDLIAAKPILSELEDEATKAWDELAKMV